MEFRNTFRWLIQVFHFTDRNWHLPSASRSQCSQVGQALFSPALVARKHTDLHLVILNREEHGQQSTAPTWFRQACLTWFTVSLISVFVNTLIPILQLWGLPRQHQGGGCSWVMMLRMPNPRAAPATSVIPTASNGEKSTTVLHAGSGWMPMHSRQPDPCLLPPQLMLSHHNDKLNNLQKKHCMCFTSVHPLSVLTVLHHKKKRD